MYEKFVIHTKIAKKKQTIILWWMWISPLFGMKRSSANVPHGTENGSRKRIVQPEGSDGVMSACARFRGSCRGREHEAGKMDVRS